MPLAMVVAGLMIGNHGRELAAADVAIMVTLLARLLTVGLPARPAGGLQPVARQAVSQR